MKIDVAFKQVGDIVEITAQARITLKVKIPAGYQVKEKDIIANEDGNEIILKIPIVKRFLFFKISQGIYIIVNPKTGYFEVTLNPPA